VATATGSVTIAVAATNGTCAFGRWIPPAPAEYVTMANEQHCRASVAPPDGWDPQPGGAASDLPDENG
jgi:hypothetical protein